MILGRLALLLIILPSMGLFGWQVWKYYRLLRLAKLECRFDNIPERLKSFLIYVLGHKRMLKDLYPGLMHLFIFWGFVILVIGYINAIGSRFFSGFSIPLTNNNAFLFLHEAVAILALVGVLMAFFRRLILRPKRLEYTVDAYVILTLIFLIVCADIVSSGLCSAKMGEPWNFVTFASSTLGGVFASVVSDRGLLGALGEGIWWFHIILVFGFLVYLPSSKHIHILAAAFNVFLRNLGPKGALVSLDLENTESYGVSRIEEYTWKQLFDLFACTECGRCEEGCPATMSEKPLSPKKIHRVLKDHLKKVAPDLLKKKEENMSLIGKVLTSEEIWSCTTCGYCQEQCPVFNEHIQKLVDLRRNLVLMESSFPQEVVQTFKSMETNSNPYGIGFSSRADWCDPLAVRKLSDGEKVDLLYWVGCAASFDDRSKKVGTSLLKILQAAGVNFGILGAEEGCCGDSARRIGNEYLFQTLAQANIEVLKNYEIKKILVHCPHCYNTLKHEYPQFGGKFEVVHSLEFIEEMLREKILHLEGTEEQRVCYHDSCYLGRFNGIYEAPREVLRKIPQARLLEMKRSREKSFCCGAGGGRMWMEEKMGKRINILRAEEALSTNPGTIAISCPYCLTMIEDGVKSLQKDQSVKVADVVELLERCLKRNS